MKTPDVLQNSTNLTDDSGYLTVDKYALQHTKYPNIYGLGDCTNTPNSKTAAAVGVYEKRFFIFFSFMLYLACSSVGRGRPV